jgi:p55-binding region of Methyl-CpG-binding domain proteins MBD
MFTASAVGLRQDANLSLPIRQTASIFKQPVTIVSNHPDSKTRTDLRHGVQEQPRQVCELFNVFNFSVGTPGIVF